MNFDVELLFYVRILSEFNLIVSIESIGKAGKGSWTKDDRGEAVSHVENATRSLVDREGGALSKDPLEFEIIGSVFIEPCSHFLVDDEDGSGASPAVSETSRNTSMLVNIDRPGRLKYHDPR